jgi:hypothetical protein
MNQQQKLIHWAQKELVLIENSIIEDGQGGYLVFSRYHIEPKFGVVEVRDWNGPIHDFANKRVAMSWCVADRVNNINLANQILSLDKKKQHLSADIECRKKIRDGTNTSEFEEIVNTKLEPKIHLYRAVSRELEKCINWAKYIQIKGFDNETARIHGF